MDRDGAVKLLEAARTAGIERYVMVSSIGAENPPDDDDVFSVYLRAKAEADRALMNSDRAWTIVRPGRLTDDPGTGRVQIDVEPARGNISRDDVAAVLDAVLHEPRSVYLIIYVLGVRTRSRRRWRRPRALRHLTPAATSLSCVAMERLAPDHTARTSARPASARLSRRIHRTIPR